MASPGQDTVCRWHFRAVTDQWVAVDVEEEVEVAGVNSHDASVTPALQTTRRMELAKQQASVGGEAGVEGGDAEEHDGNQSWLARTVRSLVLVEWD